MKKVLFITMIAVLSITACKREKDTKITVQLTWTDDSNLDLNDGWKISVYQGAIGFTKSEDFENETLETKSIKVNDKTVDFTVPVVDYENFTVVAFHDDNDNNKFDSGENATSEFDGIDAGVDKTMSLDIDY